MKITKKDYEERKARVDAGTGSDEDARLVKHYELVNTEPTDAPAAVERERSPERESGGARSAGTSTPPSADPPQRNETGSSGNRRSRARTTENP